MSHSGIINTMPSDMSGRQSSQSSDILFRSTSTASSGGAHPHVQGGYANYGAVNMPNGEIRQAESGREQACCGVMSPVRRTFCLLTAFDLILMFILWVIYTQTVKKGALRDIFVQEVVHYTFEKSLFDTVMCAACRFVPLILAYALWRIRNPWVVAVTTLGTCIFLVAKVFQFDFHDQNIVCYLLLVASFVIAWAETWFLDFKVLPRERRDEARAQGVTDRTPIYDHYGPPHHHHHHGHDNWYSPPDSRAGSDDEESHVEAADFQSLPGSPGRHSFLSTRSSLGYSLGEQEKEYQEKAREAWDKAWEILHTTDGWKIENGKDHDTGCVFSRKFPEVGKLFKLEGYVEAPPKLVFEELVIKVVDTPKWNPTVLECHILQGIDDSTDICYNVAAEAAGGLVASRDFVTLRHWATKNDIILSSGMTVSHPAAPPNKKHVRGENRPGGWIFMPVPGHPNKCLFCWIINTDLKGWMPQYVVDQAFGGMLMEFIGHVRNHMDKLTASAS